MVLPLPDFHPTGALDAETLDSVAICWEQAMRQGDFEAAWRQTDRIEIPRRLAEARGTLQLQPYHLMWNGSSFAGRTVLVRCLHGLGDSIQFMRYCPLLRETAERVIVKAQPALLELFRGMRGIDLLVNAWTDDPEPTHDVGIECMELAYAFRHSAEEVPANTPYLCVERFRASPLFSELSAPRPRKVGLVWEASEWNTARSIPLINFVPLGAVPGFQFYSFQQGPARGEPVPFVMTPLSERTEEIADAAAAMLAMDLIITVDSMTAHLAGALGRPVWLLLNSPSDWRWMDTRDDSPWYRTMRIFRYTHFGSWKRMLESVAEALRSL